MKGIISKNLFYKYPIILIVCFALGWSCSSDHSSIFDTLGKAELLKELADQDDELAEDNPEEEAEAGDNADDEGAETEEETGENSGDESTDETEEEDATEEDTTEEDTAEEDTAEEDTTPEDTTEEDATEEDTTEEDTTEDNGQMEDSGENNDQSDSDLSCTNPQDFIFNEDDGLLLVELESAHFSGSWQKGSNHGGFTGDGYMVWTGNQYFGTPGNGKVSIKVRINHPGTYQFAWRSVITNGNDATEHNDTWLRFPDADDYFAEKSNGHVVYPIGSGQTPNPDGASSDNWFKVYVNSLNWTWSTLTSDNDGHKIYATFNSPGIYTIELSARSTGHGIDKFVLFDGTYSLGDATSSSNPLSDISCN